MLHYFGGGGGYLKYCSVTFHNVTCENYGEEGVEYLVMLLKVGGRSLACHFKYIIDLGGSSKFFGVTLFS